MKALPHEFDVKALYVSLADGWGFEVAALDYAPVGGGSYHWIAEDREGERRFVTVDDLDSKTWLGATRDTAFDGLKCAFDTAAALRDSGLDFVVAPIVSRQGETLRRIGPRHTIALLPFVDGQAGQFGRYDDAERAVLVTMLAELHEATRAVRSTARSVELELPGRRELDAALAEMHQTWVGGPLSEPARALLGPHATEVAELLAVGDRLAAEVATHRAGWVITHGEPHAANVLRAAEGHLLVDWDTVAVAPPERDLWMLVDDDADQATAYADATGHQPDPVALSYFRLRWDLADIAAFTNVLRSPHREDKDSVWAYDALAYYVNNRDRWQAVLT